jgi:hypothetical protein
MLAQLWHGDEGVEADVFRQGREPILGRLGLALRPLHEQQLFGQQLGAPVGGADAGRRNAS